MRGNIQKDGGLCLTIRQTTPEEYERMLRAYGAQLAAYVRYLYLIVETGEPKSVALAEEILSMHSSYVPKAKRCKDATS